MLCLLISYLSLLLLLEAATAVIEILFSWAPQEKLRVVCEIWAAYGGRYEGYGYVTPCGLVDTYQQYIHTVSVYSAT